MTNNKIWILLAAIVSVAVLAMGWFLGVSPKLDEMTLANTQRASVDDQNVAQQKRIDGLKKQFAQIDKLKAELAVLQVDLPPGDELSTFLGQLHELEGTSGVTLTKFAASDGQLFVAAPAAAVDPLVTAQNFVPITIDLTATGTREQAIKFVSDLQFGKRLFLINKLTVEQSESDVIEVEGSDPVPKYTVTISGYVYVLVDPSAPPPAPTPVGSLDTTGTPSK